jgi:capsular polysaccharide biosynthesis protein
VVAFFVGSTVAPNYTADATALVGPINTDQSTLGASQDLVQTYGSLVTSDSVIDYVIEQLDLQVPSAEVRASISARAESVTRLLTITAVADDPQLAADIANTVADGLGQLASQGLTRPEGAVSLISRAQPNPDSAQPFIPLIVVLASAAGLVAGLAAVLLIDYFGDTVSSREDLTRLVGAPVLASISPRRFLQRRSRPLVVEAEPESSAALAYRLVAGHLSGEGTAGPVRRILVLGAEGHEGGGEVAANLAAVLVRAGQRVRLVDANDEDHEISHLFNLRATMMLGELARTDADLVDRMTSRVFPGIDVIGVPPGRDPRLRDLAHITSAMKQLETETDVVILHTGPVHRSQSALLWARVADGVILVAKRDTTKRDSVTISVESLRVVGTPVLGAILHAVWRRPVPGDVVGPEPDAIPSGGLMPAITAEADSSGDAGPVGSDRSTRSR